MRMKKLLLPSLFLSSVFTGTWATIVQAATNDADNDGILDAVDEFPCRADVSSSVFVPAENSYATLYVEDQWPSQGDYDFNDLVLDYNVEMYKSGSNVKSVRLTFHPRAAGAAFNNGAAVHLPLTLSSVSGVQITRKVGSGSASVIQPIDGETDLVVKIADNIRAELFAGASGTINTEDAKATAAGSAVEINITFSTPVALNTALAPFDVFLYRTDDYSHQIHRPQFSGTTRMRGDLFGTLDDGSNASKKFVDVRGVPFILDVPTTASFPKENTRIDALFPDIVSFGQSGGSSNQNFFSVNVRSQNAFGRSLAAAPTVGQIAGLRDNSCVTLRGIPQTGLVAAYTFEETSGDALDLSPTNNPAILTGSPTRVTGATTTSRAMRFNGSGQFLRGVHKDALNPRNEISIAMWVKPSTVAPGNQGLIDKGTRGGNTQNWGFYLMGDELGVFTNFPSRSSGVWNSITNNTANIKVGEWTHVAVTINAVTRVTKYYKNGVLIETFNQTLGEMPLLDQAINEMVIASDAGAPADYAGDLDDIYVWNRVLSDAEIFATTTGLRSVGLTASTAGQSCKAILQANASFGDGTYFIDPDTTGSDAPFAAFCDMTTDGGGWTLAMKTANTARIWQTTAGSNPTQVDDLVIENARLSNRVMDLLQTSDFYFKSLDNLSYTKGNRFKVSNIALSSAISAQNQIPARMNAALPVIVDNLDSVTPAAFVTAAGVGGNPTGLLTSSAHGLCVSPDSNPHSNNAPHTCFERTCCSNGTGNGLWSNGFDGTGNNGRDVAAAIFVR